MPRTWKAGCLSAGMAGTEVLSKKQRWPKKINQKRARMTSRSNILKKIIESLKNGQYLHMLYWNDRWNKEFTIKFVHMNNKEFKKADYLALFKALDKLSNNYEEYVKEDKYEHKCKIRCKSNLKKLCGKDNNKALTLKKVNSIGKSIQLRIYKLNDDSILCEDNPSGGGNVNVASPVGPTLLDTDYTIVTGDRDVRNATLIDPSTASPVGSTMFDTYCVTENKNEIVRNAIPQMDHSIIYEHEKQMGENVVTLPAMSVLNPAFYGLGSSSIEENGKCESMDDRELLDPKIQSKQTIQNIVTLPAMPMENPAFIPEENTAIMPVVNPAIYSFLCRMEYCELLDKQIQVNMEIQNKQHQEEDKIPLESLPVAVLVEKVHSQQGTMDISETNYEIEVLKEKNTIMKTAEKNLDVEEATIKKNTNEEFQDLEVETKKWSQLVPSSPVDYKGISNDPFSEYEMDYNISKPMQLDNDPLLSSTSIDLSSTNLFDWEVGLPSETEDFYSFEKLSSIDAD